MNNQTKQPHILIADDEKRICSTLADLLRIEGYHVTVTFDGTGVMPIIEKEIVDLLLLDVMMPGMDGMETLAIIKKQSPHTRVIMISGYSTDEYVKKAKELGADGYITKPLGVETLLHHIKSVLQGTSKTPFHEPPIE